MNVLWSITRRGGANQGIPITTSDDRSRTLLRNCGTHGPTALTRRWSELLPPKDFLLDWLRSISAYRSRQSIYSGIFKRRKRLHSQERLNIRVGNQTSNLRGNFAISSECQVVPSVPDHGIWIYRMSRFFQKCLTLTWFLTEIALGISSNGILFRPTSYWYSVCLKIGSDLLDVKFCGSIQTLRFESGVGTLEQHSVTVQWLVPR